MKIQRLVGVSALLLSPRSAACWPRITANPVSTRTTQPKEMKGVVAEYRWRNPHILFFWDVKDENGKVVRWVGEFASIASALARGMTKDTFKVGEEVTVRRSRPRPALPWG